MCGVLMLRICFSLQLCYNLEGFILILSWLFFSSRGLVFKAEGERRNNKTSSWNVVDWELVSTSLGLFSFSRARSMKWRKSKWTEQPIRDRWIWNGRKAAYFYSVTWITSTGPGQIERMWGVELNRRKRDSAGFHRRHTGLPLAYCPFSSTNPSSNPLQARAIKSSRWVLIWRRRPGSSVAASGSLTPERLICPAYDKAWR